VTSQFGFRDNEVGEVPGSIPVSPISSRNGSDLRRRRSWAALNLNTARAVDLVGDGATGPDVCESCERTAGHAPGAIHVALGDIDGAARSRLDRPVLVISPTGVHSLTSRGGKC
jgi:hypothetical protein